MSTDYYGHLFKFHIVVYLIARKVIAISKFRTEIQVLEAQGGKRAYLWALK